MKRFTQIIYNASKGFYEDGCSTRAAALTYFTLMSIVPVLAVALGFARGFGFAKILEDVIKQQLSEQPEVSKYMIDFAYSLLEKTTSGVIAGIGLIVLLWSVYNILGSIEDALNTIWKIPNPRSWVRKVTDYIATIIICPVFFVMSSSFTIYLKTNLSVVTKGLESVENGLFYLLPYFITWLLFTFLYFFLPNRKIPLKYGIIGVLVAGTAYQLLQTFYITVQLKLSSFGPVYGSFAALPLFLIWLNLSWMIILAGAELAYHAEVSAWSYIPSSLDFQHTLISKRVLALMTAYEAMKAFSKVSEPITIRLLSQQFGTSKKSLDEIIKPLIKYKILTEVTYDNSNEDFYYQPARDIGSIYLQTVIDAFIPYENETIMVYKSPFVDYFEQILVKYEDDIHSRPSNLLLSDTNPPVLFT